MEVVNQKDEKKQANYVEIKIISTVLKQCPNISLFICFVVAE